MLERVETAACLQGSHFFFVSDTFFGGGVFGFWALWFFLEAITFQFQHIALLIFFQLVLSSWCFTMERWKQKAWFCFSILFSLALANNFVWEAYDPPLSTFPEEMRENICNSEMKTLVICDLSLISLTFSTCAIAFLWWVQHFFSEAMWGLKE